MGLIEDLTGIPKRLSISDDLCSKLSHEFCRLIGVCYTCDQGGYVNVGLNGRWIYIKASEALSQLLAVGGSNYPGPSAWRPSVAGEYESPTFGSVVALHNVVVH